MWQGGRSWSCPSNAHSSLVLLCELAVMSCLKVVFTKDINKDVTQSHILCPTSAHELPAGGFTTGLEQDPTHQQHPPSTSLCLSSSSSVFREQGSFGFLGGEIMAIAVFNVKNVHVWSLTRKSFSCTY